MKSVIIFLLTILFYLHYGESAVAIKPNAVDSEHPGKCVDKTNNLIMDPGETLTIAKSCTRVICTNNFNLRYATCGTVGYPPNCRAGEIDHTKSYPRCCPRPICDDDNVVNE